MDLFSWEQSLQLLPFVGLFLAWAMGFAAGLQR